MRNEENKLTERQQETLDFICKYRSEKGFSPSLREIAKGIYVSKPTAQKHLMNLIEKGFVTYTPRTSRSIIPKIS